ncbi:unnamed protein product, partial [Didymodactylos carnosus]
SNNINENILFKTFSQFKYLEELYLDNNKLKFVPFLSDMISLRLISLNNNLFSTIPLCSTSLEILNLNNNYIRQFYSKYCLFIVNIIELNLENNDIKQIPIEIEKCKRLKYLNLSNNPLMKYSESLFYIRTLNKLYLNICDIKYLPSIDLFSKYHSKTLTYLDLSENKLCSNLEQLTILTSLTILNLNNNKLYELHDHFQYMTCLEILNLNNNKLKHVPECLTRMSHNTKKNINESLRELHLNGNQLTSLPDDIMHLILLSLLDISNNSFRLFPEQIVFLDHLTCLFYDQLNGIRISDLPQEFTNFKYLKKCIFSNNQFSEIPLCIFKLKCLEYIDFSYNYLDGLQTEYLSNLENLKVINLKGNCFKKFPSTLFNFKWLHTVDLSENVYCLAPPNDLNEIILRNHEHNIDEKNQCVEVVAQDGRLAAPARLFAIINDKREEIGQTEFEFWNLAITRFGQSPTETGQKCAFFFQNVHTLLITQ